MPTNRLLLASGFCRSRNPPRLKVRLKSYPIQKVNSRRKLPPSLKIRDVSATVYLSVDALVKLSVKQGDVAWLEPDVLIDESPSVMSSRWGVPVVLMALVEDRNAETRDDRTNDENDLIVVEIPPTVAASLGLNVQAPETTLSPLAWLQAYNIPNRNSNDRGIPKATSVTVRPLGRPVSTQRRRRRGSNGDRSFPTTTEVPNLDNSYNGCLLSRASLLSVTDVHTRELFVFDIANVTLQSNSRNGGVPFDRAFLTTDDTTWHLEPLPDGTPVRRLVGLNQLQQFQNCIHGEDDKYNDNSNNACDTTIPPPPPHPSVSPLARALRIRANVPPSQAVLHVVGSNDNHVSVSVETAARRVGMRYLPVRGLAAHAYDTSPSSRGVASAGGLPDQLAGLQQALQQAHICRPCVLHICDLDGELSTDDEPMRHMQEQRFWTAIGEALERFNSNHGNHQCGVDASWLLHYAPSVIVVLSTTGPLSPGPLQHNLVFASIALLPPNEEYAKYLWDDDDSFEEALPHIAGRSARDILWLRRLWHFTVRTQEEEERDFKSITQELDSRQSQFQHATQIPSVHWQDVGGLAHVRGEIMDAIELPLRHPHLFSSVRGRSGILLYGPPGSGKTLIAKAVATECGLPFLSVKGPELLGSYVGESEANVRAIFAAARRAALQGRVGPTADRPAAAILFFDELDSLAPRRGGLGDGGGVMERVVATLLAELDGRQSTTTEPCKVFTIGATNRPDLLDPSLLRPGRLDRLVYLGLASSSSDRAQILAASIRKFRLEPPDPLEVAKQVVNELPANLSGADFAAIASGALMMSLERVCARADAQLSESKDKCLIVDALLEDWDENQLSAVVTPHDLVNAAIGMKPSVNAQDLASYEQLQSKFSSAC